MKALHINTTASCARRTSTVGFAALRTPMDIPLQGLPSLDGQHTLSHWIESYERCDTPLTVKYRYTAQTDRT